MKKSKINGFKPFTGYDDISDGLKIPTTNTAEPKPITAKPPIQPFREVQIDEKAFTPMTNLVPTIESVNVPTQKPKFKGLTRKQKQKVTQADLNWEEFGALPTKQDKIVYLSVRGWSIKTEMRGSTLFHYATKYIRSLEKNKLEKKRIFFGSVNRELSENITIRSKLMEQ